MNSALLFHGRPAGTLAPPPETNLLALHPANQFLNPMAVPGTVKPTMVQSIGHMMPAMSQSDLSVVPFHVPVWPNGLTVAASPNQNYHPMAGIPGMAGYQCWSESPMHVIQRQGIALEQLQNKLARPKKRKRITAKTSGDTNTKNQRKESSDTFAPLKGTARRNGCVCFACRTSKVKCDIQEQQAKFQASMMNGTYNGQPISCSRCTRIGMPCQPCLPRGKAFSMTQFLIPPHTIPLTVPNPYGVSSPWS